MLGNWTDQEIADSAQRAIDGLHQYCSAVRDRCGTEETYSRFKLIHREEFDLVAVGKEWRIANATCLDRFRAYPPLGHFPSSEHAPEVAQVFRVLREIRLPARERIGARAT